MTDIEFGGASTAEEIDRVARLIAEAFDDLDANHYLVDDPRQRLSVMQDWFQVQVQHAARPVVGRVTVANDFAAAAVWFRRTVPATAPANYDKRLADLAGEFLPRFQELDQLLDAHHPPEDHWYLAFAAVHPDHQGKGLGTALLKHTLSWLDGYRVPVYLEATNERNAALYRRLGFADRGEPLLLGDGTPFFPMWRPKAVRAA